MKLINLPTRGSLLKTMTPKILVVGDLMVDRYHFGTVTRISPEAPIPVVKIVEERSFMGGAGNVIENLLALGAEVKCPMAPAAIPVKNRLMVGDTQVARWDESDELPPVDLEAIDQAVLHWRPDAVVISDYGKGAITYEVNEVLADLKVPTFIDTKRNPEDFQIFEEATFFPNQKEFDEYRKEYSQVYMLLGGVILKRGPLGIQRWLDGAVFESYPAWAERVVSVCGAGDTVLAGFTYAYVTGHEAPVAFANAAAAVVVGKPWTSTATVEEINEVLEKVKTNIPFAV